MNFSNIKQIVVPEGAVKKIIYNGATLWERISRYLKTVIGKVVTVTDALNEPAESLVVTFNPKQDLNGYDKPWITGNGKNLLNPILLKDQEAWNVIKIYADEGTILTASTSTPAGKGLLAYFRQPDGDQGTANGVVTAAQHKAVTQTVGSDGYVELVQRRSTGTDSFQNYNWQIEKGSSATSYEPYEGNICPISGHTEVVTEINSGNFWDEEWELGSYSNVNGEPTTYPDRIRSKNRIIVVPNTEYFFKTSNGLTAGNVYFYDANDVFISARTTIGNTAIVTPANCRYMRIAMGAPYGKTYNNNVSINYPSTDHEYHAYQGNTYTTTLGRTVYGGTLDVVSGELVVDKGFAVFDGSETWTKNTRALNAFYTARPQGCKQGTTMLSDKFIYVNNVQMLYNTYGTCYTGSSMNFSVNPETIGGDTIEDWTTWLTDNPLQVVYELTTPQTYQLTPQQINMFKYNNNFMANENDISLTYWGTEQPN